MDAVNKTSTYDKVAIITGGSSGIGKAIVKKLLQNKYHIVILDIQKNKIKSKRITFIKCDVGKKNQVKKSIQQIDSLFKKIDVLVNCAGVYPIVHLENYTDQLWKNCMETNVTGAYYLIKEVIPMMKKQKGGYIINITSGAVFLGSRDPGYSASKAALAGLTKSCAKNLAKYNILVNAVAPGPIETPMSARMKETDKKKYRENILLKRFGRPEDVANAVYFLISGEADYITGSTIHINGGLYTT